MGWQCAAHAKSTALFAAVGAHLHNAASLSTEHAAREGEINDRLKVIDAGPLLGGPML